MLQRKLKHLVLLFVFAGFTPALPSTVWASDKTLDALIHGAQKSQSDTLMIMKDGKVIHEQLAESKDEIKSIQSLTKSIVAMAIMILVEEGRITSLEAPMSTWITDWQKDRVKSQITLKMILNHTSGLPDDSGRFLGQRDVVSFASQMPLEASPGSRFVYSNIATALLDRVISKASGMDTANFVAQYIFAPLEIEDWEWETDEAGNYLTSGGLYMHARDLLKLGQLMLGKGVYQQRRILSQQSVKLMLEKSQKFSNYGLLWWLYPSGVYGGLGWGGQYIVVHPEKKLIAVRTKDPIEINFKNLGVLEFSEFPNIISKW